MSDLPPDPLDDSASVAAFLERGAQAAQRYGPLDVVDATRAILGGVVAGMEGRSDDAARLMMGLDARLLAYAQAWLIRTLLANWSRACDVDPRTATVALLEQYTAAANLLGSRPMPPAGS